MKALLEDLVGLLAPPRCAGCDEPAPGVFCPSCKALLDPAPSPNALFNYGGPIADAIHRLKYRDRSDLGASLGTLMGEAARRWAGRVDAVVPVPLHWRRRRARGYDQAALLARPIAKSLEVPALVRGLRRVRNTPQQVDLPHEARQRNVAGAFVPGRLRSASRALLIDDVKTTGATLRAASKALASGGVDEIHELVLAVRLLV